MPRNTVSVQIFTTPLFLVSYHWIHFSKKHDLLWFSFRDVNHVVPGKGFPPEETSNVTVRDHDNGTIAHFGGSILAKRNISETNTRGWKPVVHARDQFIVVPQVIGMESGNMRRPKISNLPTIIITNDNSSPVKTGRRTTHWTIGRIHHSRWVRWDCITHWGIATTHRYQWQRAPSHYSS